MTIWRNDRTKLPPEIATLQEEVDALFDKVKPGTVWTLARVTPIADEYQERIDAATARLEAIGDLPAGETDAAADAAADWDAADIARRRTMVERAFPEGLTILAATSRGKASLKPERIAVGTPAQVAA